MRAATMLPARLSTASMAACHPTRPRFSTMRRLEPMDRPSTNSRAAMVSEVLFSIFFRNFPSCRKRPMTMPASMVHIMLNITILSFSFF